MRACNPSEGMGIIFSLRSSHANHIQEFRRLYDKNYENWFELVVKSTWELCHVFDCIQIEIRKNNFNFWKIKHEKWKMFESRSRVDIMTSSNPFFRSVSYKRKPCRFVRFARRGQKQKIDVSKRVFVTPDFMMRKYGLSKQFHWLLGLYLSDFNSEKGSELAIMSIVFSRDNFWKYILFSGN